MIKGINHTMIELNETGNEYYERALLIVKPEYASVARAVLEDEAKKMLSELDVPSSIRAKRKKWKWVVCMIVSAFAGSFLTALICSLAS